MNLDKTAEIVSEYIHDPRNKQAVLINGEWGSGKTFYAGLQYAGRLFAAIIENGKEKRG